MVWDFVEDPLVEWATHPPLFQENDPAKSQLCPTASFLEKEGRSNVSNDVPYDESIIVID